MCSSYHLGAHHRLTFLTNLISLTMPRYRIVDTLVNQKDSNVKTGCNISGLQEDVSYVTKQLAREFQDLTQTIETVAEITAKFGERALLVPQYVADEEMKKARYHEMLRDDIRQFVSRSSCKTLEDMIARAREREIDLEQIRTRKPDEVQVATAAADAGGAAGHTRERVGVVVVEIRAASSAGGLLAGPQEGPVSQFASGRTGDSTCPCNSEDQRRPSRPSRGACGRRQDFSDDYETRAAPDVAVEKIGNFSQALSRRYKQDQSGGEPSECTRVRARRSRKSTRPLRRKGSSTVIDGLRSSALGV
uniref:Uncharacterized protein n=1 Tax=Lactuca sativa TaxID=4236 RepID=A0A9R1WG25_LACSA|nr:hypothetical protein LSAT_V11C100043830 [Lactuca sativa]